MSSRILDAVSLRPEGAFACLLDDRPWRDLRDVLDRMGVWWVSAGVGVAGGPEVVGELLEPPGTSQQALVDTANQMGSLLASGPAALVPMSVFRFQLCEGASGWQDVVAEWSSDEAELVSLHRALGGVDLSALMAVIDDDPLRTASTQPEDSYDRRAARRSIAARLDPDPRHLRYLAVLEAMESDPWVDVPGPEALGPWATAAVGRAWSVRETLDSRHPAAISASSRLLRAPIVIDAGVVWPLDPCSPLNLLNVALRLVGAARATSWAIGHGHEDGKDDAWSRVAHVAAASGLEYDGLAHMEAAMALDEEGRPEEAWNALVSTAFWTYRRTRAAVPSVRSAALMLAQSHGWDQIARELAKPSVDTSPDSER